MGETKQPQDLMQMLEEIGTCMLTTVDAEGRLASRPMGVAHIDEDHRLWFFSRVESEKVDDVVGEGQVNLAFVDDKTWVSVAGSAVVRTDEATKVQLWDLGAKAYFADGPEDPDVALIEVRPESAQYWEGPGSAVALVKMATASLANKWGKDSPSMGDQGRVDL